jgi:hypothetical protein
MRRIFRSPLALYGFPALAVVAFATGQLGAFLVTAVLALYAWKTR